MRILPILQACYSPDEKFVLTGTSAEGKDSSGSLVVLDAQTLEKQGEIAVDGSAVAVQVCRQLHCACLTAAGSAGLAGFIRLPVSALLCPHAMSCYDAVAPTHQPNFCWLWRAEWRMRAHLL